MENENIEVTEVTEKETPKTEIKTVTVNKEVYPEKYVEELRKENAQKRQLNTSLKEENKTLAEKLKGIEEQYSKIIEKSKTTLLAKLPEDKREKYKSMDIEVLEQIVTDFITENQTISSPGTNGKKPLAEKSWQEMTEEERADLYIQNPAHANKLMNESLISYYQTS